jgi:hypothetical protein
MRNGFIILLTAVAAFAFGACATLLSDLFLGSDYFMSEVLISPRGNYTATRFEEVGVIAYCNEVVLVTPADMSFSPKHPKQYIPYTVFEASCSTRTRIQWAGENKLLISYDSGDDGRKPDDPALQKTDMSGKVAIAYRGLPREVMQ